MTAPLTPEQQDRLAGGAMFVACLGIPLLGCVLAIYFKDMRWMVLLAPLIVFMEGAFILGGLAWIVVAYLVQA